MNFLKIFLISIFTYSLNIFGEKNYDLEVIVDGLDHPWSLVELSSGEFLLTELPGNLKLISKNGSKITEILNVPKFYLEGRGAFLILSYIQNITITVGFIFLIQHI